MHVTEINLGSELTNLMFMMYKIVLMAAVLWFLIWNLRILTHLEEILPLETLSSKDQIRVLDDEQQTVVLSYFHSTG